MKYATPSHDASASRNERRHPAGRVGYAAMVVRALPETALPAAHPRNPRFEEREARPPDERAVAEYPGAVRRPVHVHRSTCSRMARAARSGLSSTTKWPFSRAIGPRTPVATRRLDLACLTEATCGVRARGMDPVGPAGADALTPADQRLARRNPAWLAARQAVPHPRILNDMRASKMSWSSP